MRNVRALVGVVLAVVGVSCWSGAHAAIVGPDGDTLRFVYTYAPPVVTIGVDGQTRLTAPWGETGLYPGKPALPTATAQLVIPSGRVVKDVRVTAEDVQLLPGVHRVPAVEAPRPLSGTAPAVSVPPDPAV